MCESGQQPSGRRDLIRTALPTIYMIEDHSVPGHDKKVGANIIGTAFMTSSDGYLVTAKHVLHGLLPAHIQIRSTFTPNGEYAMKPGTIRAIYPHPIRDFAILQVPSLMTKRRTPVPTTIDVAVGDDVVLLGYARGTDLAFCDDLLGPGSPKSFNPIAFSGQICTLVPMDGRRVELIAYDCTTFPGNSGGPVLSLDAQAIIGVHVAGYANHVGYAVPIEICLEFAQFVASQLKETS